MLPARVIPSAGEGSLNWLKVSREQERAEANGRSFAPKAFGAQDDMAQKDIVLLTLNAPVALVAFSSFYSLLSAFYFLPPHAQPP